MGLLGCVLSRGQRVVKIFEKEHNEREGDFL